MFKYLICAVFMLAGQAFADEWRILDVDYVGMGYARVDHYRDDYFPYADPKSDNSDGREYWARRINTRFDLDLVRYGIYGLYWNNDVSGMMTESQFREVHWQYRLGCKVSEKIDFYHDHMSRHLLDEQNPAARFPVQDLYGVEVTFYKRDKT